MIDRSDYQELDATAMAELVAKGEVTAPELLEAAIAEAERLNPQLNAIIIDMFDLARERAEQELTGLFAGVPMLVKDLGQDYAGVPTSGGNEALKRAGHTPTEHSEIVQRFLDSGAVIAGRTNTPEFGARGVTEPEAWGATVNPYNRRRSPGGSSGGSAAAVAAGIVPIAGANDGGGSIRIPAACTGLFGLKPGRGRTPAGPRMAEMLHGAGVNHVLTRTVRDSARMLDAVHGPEFGSRSLYPADELSFADHAQRDPGPLRIAFDGSSPIGGPIDPEVTAALARTVELLESLGHQVEDAPVPIDGTALAEDFMSVWFARLGAMIKDTRSRYPEHAQAFETDSLALEAVADRRSATSYNAAYDRWLVYAVQFDRFMANYDLYLTPSMALRPPKIGENAAPSWSGPLVRRTFPYGGSRLVSLFSSVIERVSLDNLKSVPFTQLANLTGVPAMSVPLYSFNDGLPMGMQFTAGFAQEGKLLSLAGQLEQALPWADRRPAL